VTRQSRTALRRRKIRASSSARKIQGFFLPAPLAQRNRAHPAKRLGIRRTPSTRAQPPAKKIPADSAISKPCALRNFSRSINDVAATGSSSSGTANNNRCPAPHRAKLLLQSSNHTRLVRRAAVEQTIPAEVSKTPP